jgi:hypothetical protein
MCVRRFAVYYILYIRIELHYEVGTSVESTEKKEIKDCDNIYCNKWH